MNTQDLIENLRSQLQALEDVKTQICEAQTELMQTIVALIGGEDK